MACCVPCDVAGDPGGHARREGRRQLPDRHLPSSAGLCREGARAALRRVRGRADTLPRCPSSSDAPVATPKRRALHSASRAEASPTPTPAYPRASASGAAEEGGAPVDSTAAAASSASAFTAASAVAAAVAASAFAAASAAAAAAASCAVRIVYAARGSANKGPIVGLSAPGSLG